MAKIAIIASLIAAVAAAAAPGCTTTYTVQQGAQCSCPTKTLHTKTSLTDCHGCKALATSTHTTLPIHCDFVCPTSTPTFTGTQTVVSCKATP